MASLDLKSDLRALTEKELIKLGHLKPSDDLDSVLLQYLNLRHKRLPIKQWTVRKSTHITNQSPPKKIRAGLKEFTRKARSGEDLNPHLSTKISNPNSPDLMFYSWGIYHFHLDTAPHPNPKLNKKGFTARTKEILFAITDPSFSTIYFIDIHPHGEGVTPYPFTRQDLLRIIEENWSEVLDPYVIKGVKGLAHYATDDDIQKLHKDNINVILKTPGGRFLVPMEEGITLAGTSTHTRIEANKVLGCIRDLNKKITQDNREYLESYFKNKHKKNWDDLQFKMTSFWSGLRVKETTTGEILE